MVNSLTLIIQVDTSAMKLNDFFMLPNTGGDDARHLIIKYVDLSLVHITHPTHVSLMRPQQARVI